MNRVVFADLVGQTLTNIERDPEYKEQYGSTNEALIFITSEGTRYVMQHLQDCCESVSIEEIVGDLQDLIGSPIIRAEENSNEEKVGQYDDSQTWTFYRIATAKGLVVIRWLGTSNGYYSERVDFFLEDK